VMRPCPKQPRSSAEQPVAHCMSTARGLGPLNAALPHHRRRLNRMAEHSSIKER
jgi:hypothetical protein